MLIVAGHFDVDPDKREEFVASRLDEIRHTREEAGCIEYGFYFDAMDPGRVGILERWEDQAALDAHVAGLGAWRREHGRPLPASSASVYVYEVAGEKRLM